MADGRGVMLRAVLLAVALVLALPSAASGATISEKCAALTAELNARRDPDVRMRSILCTIAHNRSLAQARAGRAFHDIAYVARKLNEYGVCWRNVGEAIAYTTHPPSASLFLSLWWASDSHRPMLEASRYDRAGGSWRASLTGDGRTYSTLIVMDAC